MTPREATSAIGLMLRLDATDTAGVLSFVEQVEDPRTVELERGLRRIQAALADNDDYDNYAETVAREVLAEVGLTAPREDDGPDIPPWGTGTSLTDEGDD